MFLLSKIPLFTITMYGNCLFFSNNNVYKIIYRIFTRIRKHYIYYILLLLEMLCYYRLSHIAWLIPSVCCDSPPLEKILVPPYNAASKPHPLQTRNIKTKCPTLVQTMNVDEVYAICMQYQVKCKNSKTNSFFLQHTGT